MAFMLLLSRQHRRRAESPKRRECARRSAYLLSAAFPTNTARNHQSKKAGLPRRDCPTVTPISSTTSAPTHQHPRRLPPQSGHSPPLNHGSPSRLLPAAPSAQPRAHFTTLKRVLWPISTLLLIATRTAPILWAYWRGHVTCAGHFPVILRAAAHSPVVLPRG